MVTNPATTQYSAVRLQDEGQRIYLLGNTYALKDAIRDAGAHWDAGRKSWWIGKAKRAEIEQVLTRLAPKASDDQPQTETIDMDAPVVKARVRYQGKTYYAVAMGQRSDGSQYYRICFRDGSRVFWAAKSEPVEVLKSYGRPAPRYGGYRQTEYRGEQTVYPSLRSLQEYAERMKRERETGECECSCHRNASCSCDSGRGICHIHFDGCDRCGCEND